MKEDFKIPVKRSPLILYFLEEDRKELNAQLASHYVCLITRKLLFELRTCLTAIRPFTREHVYTRILAYHHEKLS